MTRLILIRHGESDVTVRRVIGGPSACTGLSELGRRQTERLRDRIAGTGELDGATHLYSSAYRRALETATIIAPALDLETIIETGFGEHDPGRECDGMPFADFVEQYGMPDWETDRHAVTFPGGETVAEFHHRVGATLSIVLREHHDGTVVVSCHGGVVSAAFRYLLGLPMTGGFDLHTLNTSLTEFVLGRPGRWRLVRYNDSAHLAGLPTETGRE